MLLLNSYQSHNEANYKYDRADQSPEIHEHGLAVAIAGLVSREHRNSGMRKQVSLTKKTNKPTQ